MLCPHTHDQQQRGCGRLFCLRLLQPLPRLWILCWVPYPLSPWVLILMFLVILCASIGVVFDWVGCLGMRDVSYMHVCPLSCGMCVGWEAAVGYVDGVTTLRSASSVSHQARQSTSYQATCMPLPQP